MNQNRRGSIRFLLMNLITISVVAMAPARAGAILPSVAVYGGTTHSLSYESDSWGVRGNLLLAAAPFLSFGPEVGYYGYRRNGVAPACPDCLVLSQRRVASYGAALRFGPPLPALHPYVIVGIGAYAWKGENVPGKTLFGMSAGLGLDLGPALSPVKFSVEGRWHGKATSATTWRGERNFYTLMAGLRLSL